MDKRVHFVAVGGSAMHNLAIALHLSGHSVTGSDDEIFDPARGRLQAHGLLPDQMGWFPERIVPTLDAVILGMHARADNPELKRAKELGLPIFSYPEYLYRQSERKKRVVIGGSHGKTTITAMILHVLKHNGVDADYMVGAQIEGFDVMVRLSADARFMVMEGDEYLSSALDPRPKFHLYKPHIALLTGIAWDHINVFPTFENYVQQFRTFIRLIEAGGTLFFCSDDPLLADLCREESQGKLECIPYSLPEFLVKDLQFVCLFNGKEYPLKVFGQHNLLNVNGARMVCNRLGVPDGQFYSAITSYEGAGRRLEKVFETDELLVFRDFAHAPSKVTATTRAVRDLYPDRHLVACVELHTFSSLNAGFLAQYGGALDPADEAMVFYSPDAVRLKRLPMLSKKTIVEGFKKPGMKVFTDAGELRQNIIKATGSRPAVLLLMSSGNFGGLDLQTLPGGAAGGK